MPGMSPENIRFIVIIEADVEDPIALKADQLGMSVNEQGEIAPVTDFGPDIEYLAGSVAVEAAMDRLRETPGVRPISGSVLPWTKAEDGSFPSMTLPRMSSRAELEEKDRLQRESGEDQG